MVDIPSLVEAAGGQLVGKVRLQKVVYLLDQLGADSGFSYEYHHYGPYSAELAEQVEDDVVFERLKAETHRRMSDGVPYIVYTTEGTLNDGALERKPLTDAFAEPLQKMEDYSATVLELAATINWLNTKENIVDWKSELIKRKGKKTENGRMEKALELLKSLNLPPVQAAAA